MMKNGSELKSIKTQTEYEDALKDKKFIQETISLAKSKVLRLSKEIAEEWEYINNYEIILKNLDTLISRWEIEEKLKSKGVV